MKLNAKHRLLADDEARKDKEERRKFDTKIDQMQKQVENIRKGLPGKYNKMSVSQAQQLNLRKQINDLEDKILELRKQKLAI